MAKFHLTNKAVSDLADIWDYTYDTWSEKQAEKYYLLLLDSCQELAKTPSLGRKYDEITNEIIGYRSYQHIIFYRKMSNRDIEIVRILHVSMDLKNKI
jgi:toxin ParE1/3/4